MLVFIIVLVKLFISGFFLSRFDKVCPGSSSYTMILVKTYKKGTLVYYLIFLYGSMGSVSSVSLKIV